jgi:4-amino-4-deoxy-L-arabinose transferase-like glycosyltransferase
VPEASPRPGPPSSGGSASRLRSQSGSGRAGLVSVVLASVLLFLACLLWAAIVPGFRTPDELQHTNSVVRLAEGGGWPPPGDARVRDALADVREPSGAVHDGHRTVFAGTIDAEPGAPLFTDVAPTPTEDRSSFDELDHGAVDETLPDQMTQHPPGYYAVAAAVYDLAGAGGWRYDHALLLLRGLTALMIGASVPVCCYVAARALTGRESVGRIAAFVPLLIPELHFIGGGVTNDGATIAASAVLWALLLTVTCSGPTRTRLLVLAVAMAAACWTKGTALSLLPCVPLGIALAYRRARGPGLRRWALPALGAAVGTSVLAFLLGGWWWALNLLRYGRLQPAGFEIKAADGDVLGVGEYLQVFLPRIRWTFFGEVGGREPRALGPLTVALTVCFLVFCVAGLLSRHRLADRLLILIGLGLTAGALFATTYGAHVLTKGLPGIQGRYLFVLLVPIATLFAAGVASLFGLLRVRARWLPPVVALVGLGVTTTGLALGFRVFYAAPGNSQAQALDRFRGWAAWPPALVAGLLGSFVLGSLALAWVSGRPAPSGPVVEGRPEDGQLLVPRPVPQE